MGRASHSSPSGPPQAVKVSSSCRRLILEDCGVGPVEAAYIATMLKANSKCVPEGGRSPVSLGGRVSRVLRVSRRDCVGVCRSKSSEGGGGAARAAPGFGCRRLPDPSSAPYPRGPGLFRGLN